MAGHESSQTERTPNAGHRRPRWWPAWLILLAAAVAWMWVWSSTTQNRQQYNLQTAAVCIVAGLLLWLWAVFFSRFARKLRLWILFGTLGVLVAFAALVRIRGVTGDLVPIFEWRWKKPGSGEELLATPPSPPPATLPPQLQNTLLADYPQFLGPNRNATLNGPVLEGDWRLNPPEELWRIPMGAGWSAFAVVGTRCITQEQFGENESVTCYDLATGQRLWVHADKARFFKTIAGEGPRATPTVVSNRVYTMGATGILNCLDLATGKRLWSVNVIEANHGRLPEWGMSCSPLVWEGLVIVTAGGKNNRSLVAYRADDGTFVWGGGHDDIAYSSPMLTTLDGQLQVVIFNAGSVAGHDPHTGKLLWEYPWRRGHPHVAMPVKVGSNQLVVSSGYGTGCDLIQIQRDAEGKWTAKRIWHSIRLKSKFNNFVHREGYIYGLDDGALTCVDVKTGERMWKAKRYGHGQMILLGEQLLITAENGEVNMIEPVPQAFHEIGRARLQAFHTKTWNPPALAGQLLLLRNDQQAACYRVPLPQSEPASR